ncbi:MAG: sensor histidine kinase [Myxococcales bacterium]
MQEPTSRVTFEQLERRAAAEAVRAQARQANQSPIVHALLEAADTPLVVLNGDLQIVAANGKALGDEDLDYVLGLRTGEALGCARAQEGRSGCGTSEACRGCGVLRTILRSKREDRVAEDECLLSVGDGTRALELHVRATPVRVEGERMLVVALRDVSAEKRREVLEQVFFHDVLNTLNGLLGWIRVLERTDGARSREAAERIAHLSSRVARAIQDQRDLLRAERGQLEVDRVDTRPSQVLDDVRVAFLHHPVARGRRLAVRAPEDDRPFSTDPSLLLRVLANMVTNAFEATPAHGEVELRSERSEDDTVLFEVRNEAVIPREVAHRIFQRSFTTKGGKGRGLGTYSMKLFGERYLGGRVWFDSGPEQGTRFAIELPAVRTDSKGFEASAGLAG